MKFGFRILVTFIHSVYIPSIDISIFVSEYGAWGNGRVFDANRILKATYQSFDISKTSSRFLKNPDFYSSVLGGTQWVSDFIKRDQTYGGSMSPLVVERAYPRRIQGNLMSFYYNDNVKSSFSKKHLSWAALRIKRNLYFEKQKFVWMVWRGRNSEAPSEIFIPRHFDLDHTLIMTENEIVMASDLLHDVSIHRNMVLKKDDENNGESGLRLFLFDEKDPLENEKSFHFALIVEMKGNGIISESEFLNLRSFFTKKIKQKKTPLILIGRVSIDGPKKEKPNEK